MTENAPNPLEAEKSLKRPANGEQTEDTRPPQPIFPDDSAITKAEKIERNGFKAENDSSSLAEAPPIYVKTEEHDSSLGEGPAAKKVKLEHSEDTKVDTRDKVKGIALVKTE